MTLRILVTGGHGMVGSAVAAHARARNMNVRISSRQPPRSAEAGLEYVQAGDLAPTNDWSVALQGVDAVVHCAARVHAMRDVVADPLTVFRTVNTAATLNLARQASAASVKRFIFLSSVKVNGEFSRGRAFTEADAANPQEPYSLSKHEAELGLRRLAAETGMEVVIIRPPLVYGAGVKANFASLMRAVQRGLPLPIGAVDNRRSLVGLDNLVDFILTCVTHPAAANETFLVSDGCDLSTAELARALARASGVGARLLPVPLWLLRAGAVMVRKEAAFHRLCGDFQVDISKARDLLGWQPPASPDQGLQSAVLGMKSC